MGAENHQQEGMRHMSAAVVIETEQERVERWRLEELVRAGFDPAAAAELAPRFDIDLHNAIELIDRGCPPALAFEILL
jgi:hypothetical protein